MALWKDSTATKDNQTRQPMRVPPMSPEVQDPARASVPPKHDVTPTAAPASRVDPRPSTRESLIADNITIEGKIEGTGSVRIAGIFKGNVNVQGDLIIEQSAKLTGNVRADKVTIAGELQGNVEQAALVELQQSATVVGDVKSDCLTVAAGARLRGQAEFGWDEAKTTKFGPHGGNGAGSSTFS